MKSKTRARHAKITLDSRELARQSGDATLRQIAPGRDFEESFTAGGTNKKGIAEQSLRSWPVRPTGQRR
jgi:hypothetical protein